jgi:RHS repeat-associated protein
MSNGNGPLWQSVDVSASNGSTNTSWPTGYLLVPPAGQLFQYDADGNLSNDNVWVYLWDAENRLVQMSNTTSLTNSARKKLVFEYDAQGRRIRKIVYPWGSTDYSTTPVLNLKFLYDGWNLIAELNATNQAVVRSYVWGLDLSGSEQGAGGVGGLLLVKTAGQNAQFAAYDGNGNVAGLVDATSGTATTQYEYGPFGEVIRATGSMAKLNPFRFSTKYQDDETDLLYYGYRYYNASTGTWLSRDPIGEAGGENLYAMAGNSPLDFHDILGLRQRGHHLIAESILRNLCGDKGQQFWENFLDVAEGVIPTPLDDHDFTAHAEYNKRVARLITDFMRAKKLRCNCLKKGHAKKFLQLVRRSTDPYIRGFNSIVAKGAEAVKAWYAAEGAAIRAEEAAVLAGRAGAVVRYARYGGKVVKVVLVGSFIYIATENGLQAAAEQTVRDLVFADEILAGGAWLEEMATDFLTPLGHGACCSRNGLDLNELLE